MFPPIDDCDVTVLSLIGLFRRVWYTSGVKDPNNPSYYRWEGDSTNLRFDLSFWNTNGQQQPGNVIAYSFNGRLTHHLIGQPNTSFDWSITKTSSSEEVVLFNVLKYRAHVTIIYSKSLYFIYK